MSNLYKITFNTSKEKISYPGDELIKNKEDVVIGVKMVDGTRKEIELQILESLLKWAMNSQADMEKMFKCHDTLGQVQSIDGEKFIKFEKEDVEFLKLGFSKTADKRPPIWMEECADFMRQIHNPEEEEIKKK